MLAWLGARGVHFADEARVTVSCFFQDNYVALKRTNAHCQQSRGSRWAQAMARTDTPLSDCARGVHAHGVGEHGARARVSGLLRISPAAAARGCER